MQYENGVRTEYGYDPASLRLRELRTHRPETGAVYFHTRYDIDKAGMWRRSRICGQQQPDSCGRKASGTTHSTIFWRLQPDPTAGYSHVYEYDQAANFIRNPLIGSNPLFYEMAATAIA